MKLANFLIKTREFIIKRITELFGLIIILFSLSVLISLITYSPDDPNFIINNPGNIENLMGFNGSILSDFLFQSTGLIAFLIPITLFFSGTNILINKNSYCLLIIYFFVYYISFRVSFFHILRMIHFFDYKWKWRIYRTVS